MFDIALLEPEIAGNAGSVARTCLALGARLHLVRPLGFRLTSAALRRAGMDYWDHVDLTVHTGWAAFSDAFRPAFAAGRVFAFSARAPAAYGAVRFARRDVLLFGCESRGLPDEVLRACLGVRLPMRAGVRSLNLAASVAAAAYLAWAQLGFEGAEAG